MRTIGINSTYRTDLINFKLSDSLLFAPLLLPLDISVCDCSHPLRFRPNQVPAQV